MVRIEPEKNRLIVGGKKDVYSPSLTADDPNWIALEGLHKEHRADVQIRYRRKPAPALLLPREKGRRIEVLFDEPQLAVAPGQTAVFYDRDNLLGAGTII